MSQLLFISNVSSDRRAALSVCLSISLSFSLSLTQFLYVWTRKRDGGIRKNKKVNSLPQLFTNKEDAKDMNETFDSKRFLL